jgi:hypothetical protein
MGQLLVSPARKAAGKHIIMVERADRIAQIHAFGRCVVSANGKTGADRSIVKAAYERWIDDVAGALEEYHQAQMKSDADIVVPADSQIEVSQPSLLDTNREQRAVRQEQKSAALQSRIADVNAQRQSVMEETKRARIAERIANNRKSRDARFAK